MEGFPHLFFRGVGGGAAIGWFSFASLSTYIYYQIIFKYFLACFMELGEVSSTTCSICSLSDARLIVDRLGQRVDQAVRSHL